MNESAKNTVRRSTLRAADASNRPDEEDEPDRLNPGDRVEDYRIERLIGTGGFGTVYEAVHDVIEKRVAIKLLRAEHCQNRETVNRFIREAKAVNRIQHRSIVDIFGFGVLPDGRHFCVMELIDGQPLDVFLENNGIPPVQQAFDWLRRVAEVLDAAHAAGVAHRDLKPENIILTWVDGATIPKLVDFGIAKLIGQADQSRTQSGQILGTPLYMAPEQWRGKVVDHTVDIYSLGVMAYELLSGVFPYDGDSPGDVMIKACTADPPPISGLSNLPKTLDAPLASMLAKQQSLRPQTASAAIAALEQAFAEGAAEGVAEGQVIEPPSLERSSVTGASVNAASVDVSPSKPPTKSRTVVIAASVACIVTVGVLRPWMWFQAEGPLQSPAQAEPHVADLAGETAGDVDEIKDEPEVDVAIEPSSVGAAPSASSLAEAGPSAAPSVGSPTAAPPAPPKSPPAATTTVTAPPPPNGAVELPVDAR